MLDTGELKLFISELGCTKKLFTVKVYLLKKFASTLKRVLKHAQLLDSQLTLLKKKTLLSIDVTKAVQIWLSHKHFEQFLLVEIVHIDGSNPEPHSIFLHSNESDTDNSVEWSKTKEPLLVLYSTDPDNMSEETPTAIPLRKPKRSRRRRRSVEDRFNNKCERHSLMVDFHEINWSHWIVAPKAFNAFLCDGLCPFPLTADINATNHAIVQTILHVFDSRIAPSVCCIPMTLKTMMILYIDYSGSVTLRKYINMIVDSCGCG
uniref:Bone morphogenetic protein n=1 Tax=Hofstenia miamia TaxID=442651 RepID=A0A068CMY5_HOFMI|nr:bone morphogenetic protein [Hofstenia miamia]